MGDCVDTDVEADEDSAFVNVRDRPGVLALNLAFTQLSDGMGGGQREAFA